MNPTMACTRSGLSVDKSILSSGSEAKLNGWANLIFDNFSGWVFLTFSYHLSAYIRTQKMAWMTQKVKKNDTCWIKQANMPGRCLQICARHIKFWSNINLMIQSNIKLNRYVAFVGTGGGGAGLGGIVGLKWPEKIWKFWAGNWKFCEYLGFGNNLFRVSVTR